MMRIAPAQRGQTRGSTSYTCWIRRAHARFAAEPENFGEFLDGWSTGYRAALAPPLSRRDEEGFSSCSTRPCPRAVALTPPEWPAAPTSLRRSMLPSPSHQGLGLRNFALSRLPVRSLTLRPGHSLAIPKMAVSMGFRASVSLGPAIQATGPLALAPAGLTPAERVRLRWTHDGMKRLASRLTWWHRLPHTSTPRGRAWATTCGDPSTRLAPVSPMGAVGPPVTAPAASPSTAVAASMSKAMALIGGRRDAGGTRPPVGRRGTATITKERPWATSRSCTR